MEIADSISHICTAQKWYTADSGLNVDHVMPTIRNIGIQLTEITDHCSFLDNLLHYRGAMKCEQLFVPVVTEEGLLHVQHAEFIRTYKKFTRRQVSKIELNCSFKIYTTLFSNTFTF